jgi:hypothetical protein
MPLRPLQSSLAEASIGASNRRAMRAFATIRRIFANAAPVCAVALSCAVAPDAAAQSAPKVARIGYLVTAPPDAAEQKFEVVINLKTAKALGVVVHPAILQQADQLIG